MSAVTSSDAPMSDADIRAFVETLLKEKGENGLQQALQQRIQRTKKLESECATITKKAEAEKRQSESYREESAKLLAKAKVLEQHCTVLSKEVSEWPDRRQKRVDEWSDRITSVKSNVEMEAQTLNAKMDIEDKEIAELEAENIELKKTFDSLRSEFDEAFKAYEENWKVREERTKASIAELHELQETNTMLKAEGLLSDKHVQRLTESIAAYSEQLEMYESRFDDVEATAMRSDDIKKLADKQQQQIQEQIDAVENNRRLDVEEKQRYDNETQKLRAKLQQLKKKLTIVERAKTQAEAKCRDMRKTKK